MSAYHGMSRDDLIKRLDEETARADRNGQRADRLEAELSTRPPRAEVLEEAQAEVVAWLEKKAREHHAQGKRYEKQAAVIWRLADKVSRGAVKVFPHKPRRQVEDVRADEIGGGPRG